MINKIPSWHIRKWYYQLMGAKIGADSGLSRRVEVSFPKGLVWETMFALAGMPILMPAAELP